MYNRLELRVILIGEIGVGKKSIVKRFKMLNCSETKIFSTKDENNINNKDNDINNNTKTTTDSKAKLDEKEQIDLDEKNMLIKREEKRQELMNFSLIYKIRMNYFEIRFFPCIEALPLEFDYESKEDDDELLELEKEYKFTLRPLIKEIKDILLTPPENPNNQIEFLFLLCFDLSNFDSYNKLLIYFDQLEKKLKISENFKVVLVGNKIDKKSDVKKEDKEKINKFKNKIKANYYEISTMMFFPFDKFFETLVLENLKEIPLLNNEDDKNLFHETLMKKNNFSKAERKIGADNGISGEVKFKYNKDQYEYPSTIKDLMRVFQDPDKFNKSIFLTKIGAILPPIKKKVKDKEYTSFKKEQNLLLSKMSPGIKVNPNNKKIKEALELTSRKPGYSFGFKFDKKSLNLKNKRKALSEARYNALEEFMKENTTKLYCNKNKINQEENKGMNNQSKYEQNRNEILQKREDDFNLINEEKKKRNLDVIENNTKEAKKRIDKILEKINKYNKKYSEEKKTKEKKRIENIVKNNLNSLNITTENNLKKSKEPKAKFYTPKSFILTNKGFTFGHKYTKEEKIKKVDYPEFPLFKDDFEKILLKNKKIIHTSINERFPKEKAHKSIDDSKLQKKQIEYEKKRDLIKMNKTATFEQQRKDFKKKVDTNKKNIEKSSEMLLEEYIMKTYNGENNYLKREINYTQVENASPKYSFREKTKYGSIFSKEESNTNDYYNNNKSTNVNSLNLENPDIQYTHMRYPKFSFGKSKRFNITSDDFQGQSTFYNNTDYNYTQSFLKAQTFMGTSKKMEVKYNGVPGPNVYKIQRFADDIVEKSKKNNLVKTKFKNIDNYLETQ